MDNFKKFVDELHEKRDNSSKVIGFYDVLTLIFIACKLLGIISWSWWWVLAPLWIPYAIIFILILIVGIIACIGDFLT